MLGNRLGSAEGDAEGFNVGSADGDLEGMDESVGVTEGLNDG